MSYTKSQEDAIIRFREENGTEVPKTGSIQYYTPDQINAINQFRKENNGGLVLIFNPTYGEKLLSDEDKKKLEERGKQMEASLYRKK